MGMVAGCSDSNGETPSGTPDAAPAPAPDAAPAACLDRALPKIKIAGTITASGSGAAQNMLLRPGVETAVAEINAGCGIPIGGAQAGSELVAEFLDPQDSATVAPSVVQQAIDNGAAAIIFSGGSVSTVPSVPVAVKARRLIGNAVAASPKVTGCTAMELADLNVVKKDEPTDAPGECYRHEGFHFRGTAPAVNWGRVVALFVKSEYPTHMNAVGFSRNDEGGRPIQAGFVGEWTKQGGVVEANQFFDGDPSSMQLKPLLQELVKGKNPDMLMSNLRIGNFQQLLEAYVLARDDAAWTDKPANFDKLLFAPVAALNGDYSSLSVKAMEVLRNQAVILSPHMDEGSPAFQKWKDQFLAFNPDGKTAHAHTPRAYDMTILIALAMVKAGKTDVEALVPALREVSGPPGETVYPGEFAKARKLILEGKDVDYESAVAQWDFGNDGHTNEPKGTVFIAMKVNAAGTALVTYKTVPRL